MAILIARVCCLSVAIALSFVTLQQAETFTVDHRYLLRVVRHRDPMGQRRHFQRAPRRRGFPRGNSRL